MVNRGGTKGMEMHGGLLSHLEDTERRFRSFYHGGTESTEMHRGQVLAFRGNREV